MCEHVAVNSICPKVKPFQYLQTWQNSINLFVSFSLNGLKESVESYITHSEKKRRALFAFVYSPWLRKFLCRFSQNNVVNRGYDRDERCSCAVFFALLTGWHEQLLKRFAFLFFLHKLTSIHKTELHVLRGNPEFKKQWQTSVVNFDL